MNDKLFGVDSELIIDQALRSLQNAQTQLAYQKRALLSLYLSHLKEVSNQGGISMEDMAAQFLEEKPRQKKRLPLNTYQGILKLIKRGIGFPGSFAESILANASHLDPLLFGLSSFPAVYCFYIEETLITSATKAVEGLISGPTNILNPIIASFFLSNAKFLNCLWETIAKDVQKSSMKKGQCIQLIYSAFLNASPTLPRSLRDIIKKMCETRPEDVADLIVSYVILPSFNLLSTTLKCSFPESFNAYIGELVNGSSQDAVMYAIALFQNTTEIPLQPDTTHLVPSFEGVISMCDVQQIIIAYQNLQGINDTCQKLEALMVQEYEEPYRFIFLSLYVQAKKHEILPLFESEGSLGKVNRLLEILDAKHRLLSQSKFSRELIHSSFRNLLVDATLSEVLHHYKSLFVDNQSLLFSYIIAFLDTLPNENIELPDILFLPLHALGNTNQSESLRPIPFGTRFLIINQMLTVFEREIRYQGIVQREGFKEKLTHAPWQGKFYQLLPDLILFEKLFFQHPQLSHVIPLKMSTLWNSVFQIMWQMIADNQVLFAACLSANIYEGLPL